MAVGGVVVAAGLITLTTPKAVHAVAAALVDVTNTAANPVVTQSTNHQAAQIITLECDGINGPYCFPINSTADNDHGGIFGVPAGQSFVVTSIDIQATSVAGLATAPGCSSSRNFWLMSAYNGTETNYTRWYISPNQNYHFAYSTGFVFGPGSYVYVYDDGSCYSQYPAYDDFVILQGYLTAS
jgi:hypothetical protein